MWGLAYAAAHVGVSLFLLPCRSWGFSSHCQTCSRCLYPLSHLASPYLLTATPLMLDWVNPTVFPGLSCSASGKDSAALQLTSFCWPSLLSGVCPARLFPLLFLPCAAGLSHSACSILFLMPGRACQLSLRMVGSGLLSPVPEATPDSHLL